MHSDNRTQAVDARPQDTVSPQPDTPLCDEKEAARFLGMSVEFLQADRGKGRRIPFHRIGRAVRYDIGDLRAFVASCRVGGKE